MSSPSSPTPAPPPSLSAPLVWLATCGGLGRLPYAPGTWTSLAALVPGWILWALTGPVGLLVAGGLATLVGVWVSGAYAESIGRHDPPEAVIDELAGQWLTLGLAAIAAPATLSVMAAAFVLFRLFDILKPWPLRSLEMLPGGWGIMMDDVAAAVYAGVIVMAAHWAGVV